MAKALFVNNEHHLQFCSRTEVIHSGTFKISQVINYTPNQLSANLVTQAFSWGT